MLTKFDIVNKYLGIPYKHRGRTLEGLDCYGLIILIYKDLGFDLFDMNNYDRNWSFKGRNYLLENYHKQWDKVNKPFLFDGIMFKGKHNTVNHGGIVIDENHFIHCCRQGVCVARWEDDTWSRRLDGFYHLRARDDKN